VLDQLAVPTLRRFSEAFAPDLSFAVATNEAPEMLQPRRTVAAY
jgi:hypothetical protein